MAEKSSKSQTLNFSHSKQTRSPAVKRKKRSRSSEKHETPPGTNQANQATIVPPKTSDEGRRTSAAPTHKTIGEARIEFWAQRGIWPDKEQETTMNRCRELRTAHTQRRSPSRKRSIASISSETNQTQTSTSNQPRDTKCAPYQHPLFDEQMKKCGSFFKDHPEGATAKSKELCQTLLKGTQSPPKDTLFSEDDLFTKTCERIKYENEAKVIRDITPLIVPSAEVLADRGAEHLQVLRETVNACWVLSRSFLNPLASRPGPRPQPDFSLGFDRDAFGQEQLDKLEPYHGNLLTDSTFITATYKMYLPFFSTEVKGKKGDLDTADRQNAYTQSVILRGLFALFSLVGREKELHREINGFSISHNQEEVRIYGHYLVIDGEYVKYYRHPIQDFKFTKPKDKWVAYTFVRNMYDLWVPKHFARICEVIDKLPVDLNSDVSEQGPGPASLRSGLSQQVALDDEESQPSQPSQQPSVQPITADTTIRTRSKKQKTSK